MPKILIPHTIEPHSFDAMWQPGNQGVAQLWPFDGQDTATRSALLPKAATEVGGTSGPCIARPRSA